MDGFTVSDYKGFVDTGQTASELKSTKLDSPTSKDENGTSFSDTLKTALHQVNELHKESDVLMQKFATGQNNNIAEVKMAAEKADLALKLAVQVRNKMIDAYQEVMKMQM